MIRVKLSSDKFTRILEPFVYLPVLCRLGKALYSPNMAEVVGDFIDLSMAAVQLSMLMESAERNTNPESLTRKGFGVMYWRYRVDSKKAAVVWNMLSESFFEFMKTDVVCKTETEPVNSSYWPFLYGQALFHRNVAQLPTFPIDDIAGYFPRESKVLDLGGGLGLFSRIFTEMFSCNVTLQETPEMVEALQKQLFPNCSSNEICKTVVSQAYPPIASPNGCYTENKFDVVWLSEFLHLFPPRDTAKLLTDIRCELMPNGYLLINEINKSGRPYSLWMPVRLLQRGSRGTAYSYGQIKEMCLDHNFHLVNTVQWEPHHTISIFKKGD